MKSLQEYITESMWKSGNGTYGPKEADAMVKAWKITLKQAYKALDILDDSDTPPTNITFKKDFMAFADDDEYRYNLSEEEWEIIR